MSLELIILYLVQKLNRGKISCHPDGLEHCALELREAESSRISVGHQHTLEICVQRAHIQVGMNLNAGFSHHPKCLGFGVISPPQRDLLCFIT